MWDRVATSIVRGKGGIQERSAQMADTHWMHKIVSKRVCFAIFNVVLIVYLIARGDLRWNVISIISCTMTLALMNAIAWLSARRYKDWK
jgi:hypothetical protein